jgi:hypothetical protein
MSPGQGPDLKRALRPVPAYERAVKAVSKMLADAGIRHALAGALAANAYRRRPRTTEDIDFLVGREAFDVHPAGFVTLRVPVIEFDGIDVDQIPIVDGLPAVEDGLNRAPESEGVPIAPVDVVVILKLVAGRTQDLADVEAIVESGADREALREAVKTNLPDRLDTLERLFGNVDRQR